MNKTPSYRGSGIPAKTSGILYLSKLLTNLFHNTKTLLLHLYIIVWVDGGSVDEKDSQRKKPQFLRKLHVLVTWVGHSYTKSIEKNF